MAFNKTPSTWISGWSEDGTNISVPLASFPELTAAEADGTDGDIRKILFALNEKFYDAWNSTATADRPSKMSIQKSSSINVSTGIITNTYTIRFTCDIVSTEVSDES